jgi:hypothetical protein
MSVHEWLRLQPRPYFCPFCFRFVTKWHEHHGPKRKWRGGQKE